MPTTQTLEYNGHSAPFHRVSPSVEQVYSSTGTLIGQRWTLTISGVVTADTPSEDSLQDAVNRLRYYWLQPRKKLLLQWTPSGGSAEKMFEFSPVGIEGIDPDMEWGPLPLGLDVTNVTGGYAAEYTFRIQSMTKEAWGDASTKSTVYLSKNPIAAVEKSFSFSIDQDGFTTRTVSGTIKLHRAALGDGRGTSFFRPYVTPPLPDGFHRERQDWNVDPSGLSASFTFIDREYGDVLPAPITSGTATLSSHTELRGGRVRFSLSGRFGAPKTVSKGQILQALFSLVRSKVASNAVMESRELTASIYAENEISFRFEWWVPKIAPLGQPSPAVAPLISAPPNDGGKASVPSVYGTARLSEDKITGPFDPVTTTLAQMRQQAQKVQPSNLAGGYESSAVASTAVGGSSLPSPSDVSATNNITPIIEFIEVTSYELQHNKVVFRPKIQGARPIIQQTANPVLHKISAGVMRFASRTFGTGPQIPGPPPGEVLNAFVEPSAPTPIGDGEWNEYRVRWRYVVVDTRAIESGSRAFEALGVEVPADIRRQSSKPEKVTKGPDNIV